ncbi:allophanate hydrolase [Corynebacterium neomassiliense]|uniref:allophanate hydrolase n=1 Tax=Corynebacterium neomassiliense TaxID=2079482 RepID=UPI00102FCE03|nr:allophanate hydrolase [Corynebacterium neomassiliense]
MTAPQPYRTRHRALRALEVAYDRIAAAGRDEVFISLSDRQEARDAVEDAFSRPVGPLTGMIIAVKDNIDVLGFDTTAGCPGYRYTPDRDSAVAGALRAAGATVIGKTNLDQFATGLVGTRSPYGAVRDSRVPARISGGSSSGSAVAVALGFVDAALGTDTAGSGRIPAGLQGIVGVKPTPGVVSTRGVVPACASYDCVSVFARTTAVAEAVTACISATGTRTWPTETRFSAPAEPVVGIPRELPELSDGWREAFAGAVERLRATGCRIRTVDLAPALEAARMLYGSPLVAERAEAVGEFVTAAVDSKDPATGLDPTVTAIVTAAGGYTGPQVLAAQRQLGRRRRAVTNSWDGLDGLLIPTAPFHPTIAEVRADPVGVNTRLGTYTNFCNLFDMCATAVPWTTVDDGGHGDGIPAQFGVTVLAPAFGDAVAAGIAARLGTAGDEGDEGEPRTTGDASSAGSWVRSAGAETVSLVVVGAHLRGQPLNHQLTDHGAYFVGEVRTSPRYRLYALDTVPPKPGLSGPVDNGGASVAGEEWRMSPAELARFLDALPAPMALGEVLLDDGRRLTGFTCQPCAVDGAAEITSSGGWRPYLDGQ